MPNYLFAEPRLVFVHIPKNAGTSIRAKLPAKSTLQTFGHIPAQWCDAYSFAIIRDPIERFLSAVHMFKHGAEAVSDYYATARWPNLTIEDALDLLDDEDIPFDRSVRNLPANLKHHILPQTHPFNCLHLANSLLRHESLDVEFVPLAKRFGFDPVLPHLRSARPDSFSTLQSTLTSKHRDRIAEHYAEDFQQLGYPMHGGEYGKVKLLPDERRHIWGTWPMFFSNLDAKVPSMQLPAMDCDLTLFLNLKVPGGPGPTWAGRVKNINTHFHNLQPEFAGASRLAHLLACTIVSFRRSPGDEHARHLFLRILDEHGPFLAKELNLRWLTSVCDSIVDCGDNPVDKVFGLTGSLLANTIKLYETELRLFHPRIPHPPQSRFRRGGELFDGVISFWVEKGDMIDNLLKRVRKIMEIESPMTPFVGEIVARCLNLDTSFRRFRNLSGTIDIGLLKDAQRQHIEALIRTLAVVNNAPESQS